MKLFNTNKEIFEKSFFYQLPPFLLLLLLITFPPLFTIFAVYPLVDGSRIKKIVITVIALAIAFSFTLAFNYYFKPY